VEVGECGIVILVTHLRHATFRASLLNRILSGLITKKSIPQGAATTCWACVCPRVATPGMRGAYLADCGPAAPLTAQCRDEDGIESEALWNSTVVDLEEALRIQGLPPLNPF
jgi:hypothetical protein